jgi:hypothetical protein
MLGLGELRKVRGLGELRGWVGCEKKVNGQVVGEMKGRKR